jgi:hypothetical protein
MTLDEAIAKALSVNTLIDEVYLHGPRTYAAYRRRFVTVQPDVAVPMGLGVMRTQRFNRGGGRGGGRGRGRGLITGAAFDTMPDPAPEISPRSSPLQPPRPSPGQCAECAKHGDPSAQPHLAATSRSGGGRQHMCVGDAGTPRPGRCGPRTAPSRWPRLQTVSQPRPASHACASSQPPGLRCLSQRWSDKAERSTAGRRGRAERHGERSTAGHQG